MSTGTVIIIIIAIVVVLAAIAGIVYDTRRRRLRQRFGPEYDRVVEQQGSRRKAEAELTERQRRVRDLDIRPLDAAARARYADEWAAIQERFVDAPQEAVGQAQRLVMTVMNERGYPTEGSDQVLADLSVEHANVLDNYRAAYGISQRAAEGMASTEDLRQAMIHYRALFHDLLGEPGERGERAADPAEPDAVETTAGLPETQAPATGVPATGSGPTAAAAEDGAAPQPADGADGTAPQAVDGTAPQPADEPEARRVT